jgi:hypothetical protein
MNGFIHFYSERIRPKKPDFTIKYVYEIEKIDKNTFKILKFSKIFLTQKTKIVAIFKILAFYKQALS